MKEAYIACIFACMYKHIVEFFIHSVIMNIYIPLEMITIQSYVRPKESALKVEEFSNPKSN